MSVLTRPLSFSQISKYLRCPKAHDYSYHQGLQSIRVSPAMQLGSFVDTGLTAALRVRLHILGECVDTSNREIESAWYAWTQRDEVQTLFHVEPSAEDTARETCLTAKSIATRAIEHLELDTKRWKTLRDRDKKPIIQYEVKGPLKHRNTGYIGYIDWAATDTKTGNTWLIDFKVRRTLESEDALTFDYQLPSYQQLLQAQIGISLTGCAHYQVRAAVPEIKLKNDGMPSRAKQSCDWTTYLAGLIQRGLDPMDYAEMADKLSEFQSFTWTRRSALELDNIWAQIENAAHQLDYEAYNGHALRVMQNRVCATCEYQELCMAELRGHDTEFIRSSEFTLRKYQ